MERAVKSKRKKLFEVIAIILFGIPVLGIFFGGIYSLPAMRFTKQRDPWLTLLLAGGLVITVSGVGLVTHTPLSYMVALWFVSIVFLLLARKAYGNLGHNVERFGLVHVATLLLTFLVAVITRHPT
jgi:hypothetical protein